MTRSSHPFGDLIRQHLSRKHGLSQNKLASGIDQDPAIVSDMCHGRRLAGREVRKRVLQVIRWFKQEGVLEYLEEANALLEAAGLSSLSKDRPADAEIARLLNRKYAAQEYIPAGTNKQRVVLLVTLPLVFILSIGWFVGALAQPNKPTQTVPISESGSSLTPFSISPRSPIPTQESPLPSLYWQGEYYPNEDFQGAAIYRREDGPILAFNWGGNAPTGTKVGADNFSVRWLQCREFESGYYTFKGRADDTIEVWLDDWLLINATSLYSPNGRERNFHLTGGKHCLKVLFREYAGEAFIKFDYAIEKEPLLIQDLDSMWHGEYFANADFYGSPVHERDEPFIDFHWGQTNPIPGHDQDVFSVRWTRCLELANGDYIFKAAADDSIEVWLEKKDGDKRLVINNSVLPPGEPEVIERKYHISNGHYCLTVEFKDTFNVSSAYFDFELWDGD